LKIWLDTSVLLVEQRQIGHQILDDIGMRQGIDFGLLGSLRRDSAQASQRVYSINVHGTAAADALSAAPSKGERWINLVFDLDERVQHHGPALVEVKGVLLRRGLNVWRVGVPAIDVQRLYARRGLGRHGPPAGNLGSSLVA